GNDMIDASTQASVVYTASSTASGMRGRRRILLLRVGHARAAAVGDRRLRDPHKSITTSLFGCEQHVRTFPSAGGSRGSGSYFTVPAIDDGPASPRALVAQSQHVACPNSMPKPHLGWTPR